jgi:peptide/nickel transport system substrate-binding protein
MDFVVSPTSFKSKEQDPTREQIPQGHIAPTDVVIAAFDMPMTCDPHAAFDSASRHVVLNVYEPLLRYDGRANFEPWLACGVSRSDDGCEYRLPVRRGVLDHAGVEITPTDALYSVHRSIITAPGPGRLWLTALLGPAQNATGIEALCSACEKVDLDDDTLVFTLAEPFDPFAAVVAHWALVLSREWAAAQGAWDGQLSNIAAAVAGQPLLSTTNGTGPFRMVEQKRTPPRRILFHKHQSYWRHPVCVEKVTLLMIQDRFQRERALLDKEADFAVCQPESLERVRNAGHVVLEQTRTEWHINPLGVQTYRLADDASTSAGLPQDALSDLHLRRALTYAFDYDAFVKDALHSDPILHPGPFPLSALPNGPVPEFRHDPDLARLELSRALGGSAMRDGLEMPVYTHRDNYAREVAANILCDEFNRLSRRCRARVVALPFDELLHQLFAGHCPVAWISWDADYIHPHAFAHELLSSTALLPRSTGVTLAGADVLLAEALRTTDHDKRMTLYHRLATMAIDAHAYLFVPGKVSYLSYDSRWEGVQLFPGASNVLDFTSFAPGEEVLAAG